MNDLSLKMPSKTDWQEMTHDEQQRALFKKNRRNCSIRSCPTGLSTVANTKKLTCMTRKMGMQVEEKQSM